MTNKNTNNPELISLEGAKCTNCHSCIRACPVKYCNNASSEEFSVDSDLCISCGRCIKECSGTPGRHYYDDMDEFINLSKKNEPMIAILAPSTVVHFPKTHLKLNSWLKKMGVEAVFDVSFGAELTTKSYLNYIKKHNPELLIAQPCPVIVNYIEIYKPELLKYLAPIDSPMLHTIKYIKYYFKQFEKHKIIAISPCVAKKREFVETGVNSLNIVHSSIKEYLNNNNINLSDFEETDFYGPSAEKAVIFSSPGGLSKTIERWSDKFKNRTRQIEGRSVFNYINKLPELIKNSPEKLPLIVDCLNCALGCNGGFLSSYKEMSPDELEFHINERKNDLVDFYKNKSKESGKNLLKENIDNYWQEGLYTRTYVDRSYLTQKKSLDEVQKWKIFNSMNKFSKNDLYNCQACGYDNCEGMALAVHLGLNRPENCYHYLIKTHKEDLEIIKSERNELKVLKEELESRVEHRTESLEKQRLELIRSRKAALSLMEDSDIARKKLEDTVQKLEEQTAKAEMANEAKSNFLANMSHEIRTPMNSIIGFLQLLKDSELDYENNDFVEEALKSSEHLLSIINEILDFSKIEAGKMQMHNNCFNLRTCIEDIMTSLMVVARKKSIEINSFIDINIPEFVIGDSGRLKQVLNNLTNNAVKFTEVGEIFVKVSQKEIIDNKAIISFEVKDSGIGIPEDQIGKVFESFSQVDDSSSRKYMGTGLGLAICKKIIEQMNGEIIVESFIGKGSTFKFFIELEVAKNYEVSKNTTISISNSNILVIEDNENTLDIIDYYLSNENCNITKTRSTKQALSLITSGNSYDVVIADSHITGGSIYELLNHIKETPLIALTSAVNKTDNFLNEHSKCIFVNKPIKKNEIVVAVHNAYNNDDLNIKTTESKCTCQPLEETSRHENIKILLVEDNFVNQKVAKKVLSNAGIAVDVANNGEEAIELYKTNSYSLVLMDCQMPILDGYQATRKIRMYEEQNSLNRRIPIIALTANAMAGDAEKCLNAGMDDYITKPIEFNTLLNKIDSFLHFKRSCQGTNNKDLRLNRVIQELMEKTGFSNEEAMEIISEFIQTLPDTLVKLNNYLNNNDFENLQKEAHTLKGASGNIRISILKDLAYELELSCSDNDIETCKKIIEKIDKSINKIQLLFNEELCSK